VGSAPSQSECEAFRYFFPHVRHKRAQHDVQAIAMKVIIIGMPVFAAVDVILAAKNRDLLLLGLYAMGLLVTSAIAALIIALPTEQ
jgi:hypothetical protein